MKSPPAKALSCSPKTMRVPPCKIQCSRSHPSAPADHSKANRRPREYPASVPPRSSPSCAALSQENQSRPLRTRARCDETIPAQPPPLRRAHTFPSRREYARSPQTLLEIPLARDAVRHPQDAPHKRSSRFRPPLARLPSALRSASPPALSFAPCAKV